MQYFYSVLALATAVLLAVRPEAAIAIVSLALAITGILLLLPNE